MTDEMQRLPIVPGTRLDRLREAYATHLPIPRHTERHLAEALGTILERPGSLIRSELCRQLAEASGLDVDRALEMAVALEYFHTASLLFDDLPSMDDALERRGAVCIHRQFGEGAAILAALALINRAYALLWQSLAQSAPAQAREALQYLERYLGLGGLLNGQSQDLHYARLPLAEQCPERVAMGKTVSMIRLPLVMPALAGGTDPHTVRLLDRLAVVWGLSYQGLDDFRDLLHTDGRTGKTAGRDALLDRPNLAMTRGPALAKRYLDRLSAMAGRIVDELQRRDGVLACLQAHRRWLESEVAALHEELARSGEFAENRELWGAPR